jgi:imidazole glycerol-phosphate synthase subunit HisH
MAKTVCLIDYNAGNIMSLYHTVSKVSGYQTIISNDLKDVKKADYIILPGVGSYSYVSKYLAEKNLDRALKEEMIDSQKPILGICLGMQILFESSDEFGYSQGLCIFEGDVRQLPDDSNFPLPNIGWRETTINASSIFKSGWYYYAHSYRLTDQQEDIVIGTADYGGTFPAVINYHNFYGVQFHPEKSSENGMQFLKTFFSI